VWFQKLLASLFDQEFEPTLIHYDNQNCINISENHVFHDKSKHIEIKYHYIRYMVQRGVVELQYISTDENISNILTKPLSRVKYEYFIDNLGMM
jgi:phage pi2 protein 07